LLVLGGDTPPPNPNIKPRTFLPISRR
jgi:hypothetical protein